MRASLVLALVLAATPAVADHCETYSTTQAEVTLDLTAAGQGTYYESDGTCFQCELYSIWIYEESNGIPGLQRGDELTDDTCHGMILPDTIVI